MPKKDEYVKFKIFERKIKPPFIIYIGFESMLVPEDNREKIHKESYIDNDQKHIACS